jgi:methyl-accepting chemotaxis protein
MTTLKNLPIKFRLTLLVGLAILTSLVIGVLGLGGMRDAAKSVDNLYHVNIQHINTLGIVTEHMEDIRNHMLLALQHDPANALSTHHDHSLTVHLEQVARDIEKVERQWRLFADREVAAQERTLVARFDMHWSSMVNRGVNQMVEFLKGGQYASAGKLLFEVVNPNFEQGIAELDRLKELQMEEAEQAFEIEEANYHAMVKMISVILVIGALFFSALAYFTITGISRGMHRIKVATMQLAEGDLNAQVDYQAGDEIGHIASSVNHMAGIFRNTILEMKDAISRLASAAEETSTVTAQTTIGINQQQAESSQVATAINQMSATVQEVALNAVEAADAAHEANETFLQGKQVIDRVIQSIGDLAGEVDSAAKVIQQLEEESKHIGSVIDVIKSIAEQTNLLALNAAIEAARAGDQGRGFAVVADEVRTLAGRTQKSTQEIEEMITRLQDGTNTAVKVMCAGKEMTQVGVEQAAAAGDALKTINTAVDRIAGMNTQIASAAEEQSAVTEEISRSIVSINEVSEQSATGAQQTAAASQDLARLAEQLQGLAEHFNI